jgi:hypothetical protein
MLSYGKIHQAAIIGICGLLSLTIFQFGVHAEEGVASLRSDDRYAYSRPESDSGAILRGHAMRAYESLGHRKSEELLSFAGSTLWCNTIDLKIYGNTLYALDINGLQIFDITDLENPELIRNIYLGFSGELERMCLDDHYLYIPRYNMLFIYDITDPHNPAQAGSKYFGGNIMKVQVENDRVYIGMAAENDQPDDHPALYICDLSDRANPAVISKYVSPHDDQDCRMFSVVGDRIYAVNMWSSQIEVISIEDETRPQFISSNFISYPRNITYHDGYLYVAHHQGIRVFEVSTPDSLTELHFYGISCTDAVTIAGDKLYSTAGYDWLRIHQINPEGGLDSLGSYELRELWYAAEIDDTLLFIAEKEHGFSIFNVSDSSNPQPLTTHSHASSWLQGLDIKDNYLYVTDLSFHPNGSNDCAFFTLDISDPYNPTVLHRNPVFGFPHTFLISDTLAFISGCISSRIYSLSDPISPVYLSSYPEGVNYTENNNCRDTIMFVSRNGSLDFVNISDPANPVLIASDTAAEHTYNLTLIDNNRVYASCIIQEPTCQVHSLRTLDISDVSNPVLLDELIIDTASPRIGMVKRGKYVYYIASQGGLHILDLSNPDAPDRILQFLPNEEYDCIPPNERFYDIAAIRHYLFINAKYAIQVYDISNPLDPDLVQYLPIQSPPERLKIDSDYLYLTTEAALHIYKIDLPPIECGDANYDGTVNISDAVYIINYIFAGGDPPDDYAAADVNCDETVNVSDAVWIINYIFVGGNAPCDTDGDGVPDC